MTKVRMERREFIKKISHGVISGIFLFETSLFNSCSKSVNAPDLSEEIDSNLNEILKKAACFEVSEANREYGRELFKVDVENLVNKNFRTCVFKRIDIGKDIYKMKPIRVLFEIEYDNKHVLISGDICTGDMLVYNPKGLCKSLLLYDIDNVRKTFY